MAAPLAKQSLLQVLASWTSIVIVIVVVVVVSPGLIPIANGTEMPTYTDTTYLPLEFFCLVTHFRATALAQAESATRLDADLDSSLGL